MKLNYQTKRLWLRSLTNADAAFIFELLNTNGWIQFIGDRHIRNLEDAGNYIRKILNNPAVSYRVVTLQETAEPIGLVTFIKRDYLDQHDIGFAFLPAYQQQGFAFEATKEVLDDLLQSGNHPCILATTVPDNHASIKLLQKLGFHFSNVITNDNLQLNLFSISL